MTDQEYAQSLMERASNEHEYRNVAGRSYYAAFNYALVVALKFGYTPSFSGRDHAQVRRHLETCGVRECERVARGRMVSLHVLRKMADYDFHTPFLKASAEEAVDLLDEVWGALNAANVAMPRSTTD